MARNVLISGASKGIGRATAIAFAAAGDRVAVHFAADADAAAVTRDSLAGTGHVIVRADLSEPTAGVELVDRAVSELGHVDVLVLNAALAPTAANSHPIADTSFDHWAQTWNSMAAVNLLGPAHTTWAFAQHLIERDAPGAVVAVGSRGALRGEPGHPAYGATKAGLHAFAQSMAVALAPHDITVAAVAPGFISSERQHTKLDGPRGDAVRNESPFGRVGTPAEVASAIVYLASPSAAWSSGAILDINGASYLHP